MKRSTFIIIILIFIALIGVGMYVFIYSNSLSTNTDTETTPIDGFSPFARNTIIPNTNTISTTTTTATTSTNTEIELPKLRKLSDTPVGGMSASTTRVKSTNLINKYTDTTIVRFIDRGTGHIYEANDTDQTINKISNTTLPKIYESYWNKNSNNFILRYLKENSDTITNFYAEIRPTTTGTSSSGTPFEIKGRYLSPDINQIAVSPTGDKIFTWNIENGNGIGYISSFDEKNKTKIVDTPITQVNISWPETSTVTITTKGSSSASGYSYSINTKTGKMNKILGGIRGLSTKMSSDGKNILYSAGGSKITTNLLSIKDEKVNEVIFRTLADKCIWSTLRKTEVYCAVPTEIPLGQYPDDWYKGKVSFVDQIWFLDTVTGEVHLLANLLSLSNELIDATDLMLDQKENFLYFVNKRDLSLWSLDLNK
jgi:hypothetical protein